MILLALSVISLALSAMQATMFLRNLPLFLVQAEPTDHRPEQRNQLSVLIPARDEENGIGESLRAALASDGVELEVIVLDDHSTDSTAAIVQEIARNDDRVRYVVSAPLPPGWNGKQHACRQLAQAAKFDRLVFLDADVRLHPDGLRRIANYQDQSEVALLSVFPRQVTGTLLEKWLIPMMHYILLCFLPLQRMRSSHHPAYAAGCGQLFMTWRAAYNQAGTHAAIRASRHDGLKLPRAYRNAGLMTDVIDGSNSAQCRMYTSAAQVVRGVLKNADEGIANAKLIVPFTIMLVGGSVLPIILLALLLITNNASFATITAWILFAAITLGHLPRAVAAFKFRQPFSGVLFHSLAVLIFVALQWIAFANRLTGRQIAWRGRIENHHRSTT